MRGTASHRLSGLSRKMALESGRNHAAVSMGTGSLSPPSSGSVPFAARSHRVVLCCVRISTSLAQIEFSFTLGINTFRIKKSCGFPLVLGALPIAS